MRTKGVVIFTCLLLNALNLEAGHHNKKHCQCYIEKPSSTASLNIYSRSQAGLGGVSFGPGPT